MTKIKSKFAKYRHVSSSDNLRDDTVSMLKQAWNELPADYTFGEREFFIELAERLVKVSEDRNRRLN